MSIISALFLMAALTTGAGLPQAHERAIITIGAHVSFRDQKCSFWTGDVGLNAEQFQAFFKGIDITKGTLVIAHSADTPAHCINEARRRAKLAGFKIVRTVIDASADPIGPPLVVR